MDRKEFLSKLGGGAVFALTYACLGGCTKMDNPAPPVDINTSAPPEDIDFFLDLTLPQNAPLLSNGGYVIVNNNTVVAMDELGNYIAATRLCSHEPFKEVIWSTTSNEWLCTEHGATFDKLGSGTTTYNSNGASGLTIYNTYLNGTMLHIYE
ncbi:MAG: (2Fe-2S)-binding protein [Crocinitomicaceae bacterium]|nr:(2Fe-2S)-binding protein [Crocinitomicaceae bacterium]